MDDLVWPALATCMTIIHTVWVVSQVGKARRTYNIQPPAVTGNPNFDRIFRVQQNTVEMLTLFYPSLWICSLFVNGFLGFVLGVAWLVSRYYYALGYYESAEKRLKPFYMSTYILKTLGYLGAAGVGWRLYNLILSNVSKF